MPQQRAVPVRIPQDLLRRVQEVADQHHSSLNAAFHFVIEQYFVGLGKVGSMSGATSQQDVRGISVRPVEVPLEQGESDQEVDQPTKDAGKLPRRYGKK